jgi:hypothetical protein
MVNDLLMPARRFVSYSAFVSQGANMVKKVWLMGCWLAIKFHSGPPKEDIS